MSQEALDRFVKRLSLDEALQNQLVEFGVRQGLAPGSGKLSERSIADFATRHGFLVTVDDLKGRDLAEELSGQSTAPLTSLPPPGSKPARDSAEWWAWFKD
jgi:hypothetical protein